MTIFIYGDWNCEYTHRAIEACIDCGVLYYFYAAGAEAEQWMEYFHHFTLPICWTETEFLGGSDVVLEYLEECYST